MGSWFVRVLSHTHRTQQDENAKTAVERTFLGFLSEYDCRMELRPAIGPESRTPRNASPYHVRR